MNPKPKPKPKPKPNPNPNPNVAAGWRALLAEPVPSTFKWLRRNFAAHEAAGRVVLRQAGVTPAQAAAEVTIFSLSASVPELAAAHEDGMEDGVPPATRRRLQWASSTDERIPRRASTDLWQARARAVPVARGVRGRVRACARCVYACARVCMHVRGVCEHRPLAALPPRNSAPPVHPCWPVDRREPASTRTALAAVPSTR